MAEPKENRWQLRRYYERRDEEGRRPQGEPQQEEAGSEPSEGLAAPSAQEDAELGVDPQTPSRGPLLADNLEERTGNYLMAFGLPGSGKTTFQSFLAYYVTHIGPFEAHPQVAPEESAQGWEPMVIFNDWMRIWGEGRFPPANPVDEGEIRELSFRVRPLQGSGQTVDFSFLEASGELMTQVVADRLRDPTLIETLNRYFANEKLRMLLVLVVDPEREAENDILFQNLLAFLDLHFPKLRQRTSLGVLVSKPHEALRRLQEAEPAFERYAELSAELCECYVQRFAPRTYRIFDGWPDQQRVQLMTLHLGELATAAEDQSVRLERADYADIHDIFAWIYEQFTGGRPEATGWQRLLQWLRP